MIALTRMAQQANHPLPAGFQLDEYCIEHQLSLGGFSIVYVATDAGRHIASPSRSTCPIRWPCAAREDGADHLSEDHLPAFRYGMKCFSKKVGRWPVFLTPT
jgi:hypothetical protein